ncbi:MAG: ATP-binding protein [Deltaproteobacteria bacterium]|jgi:two-component system nitrogen regulation sensor histidine kinase GlnL|nr:ATP-binding protein [Deltaproteobacteria bacterium]MCW9050209.1 ATP-binding protein [Deltaproteobacteria bacterium]
MKQSPVMPQNYAMILDNLDDAVIAVDQQGIICLFNPAAEHFSGMSEKQSLGKSFYQCFQQQETLCYLTRIVLEEGRSISDHETIQLQALGKAKKRPVSVTVSPIFSTPGPQQGAVIIIHDLTQVRSLEDAVRHADRLSMVGTMAAGLAHEIKNPLGGIKGAAQLLQMEFDESSELQEHTQLIIRETERINRIIEELLNLTRPRQLETELVNLSQLLNDVVTLQKHSVMDRGLHIRLQPDPSIPEIPGDRDLLVRLFLNLIKNACEATADNSEVIIESKIASDYHLSLPGSRSTPMVQINIHDQGPGIAPSDLRKIFTPFYTTKTGGSGLGLATCQKIVTDHHGLLHFNEHPDGGTLVKVSLPLRQSLHDDIDKG